MGKGSGEQCARSPMSLAPNTLPNSLGESGTETFQFERTFKNGWCYNDHVYLVKDDDLWYLEFNTPEAHAAADALAWELENGDTLKLTSKAEAYRAIRELGKCNPDLAEPLTSEWCTTDGKYELYNVQGGWCAAMGFTHPRKALDIQNVCIGATKATRPAAIFALEERLQTWRPTSRISK